MSISFSLYNHCSVVYLLPPILVFSDDEGDDDEDDSDEYEDVDEEEDEQGEVVDDPALQVRGVQLTPRSPREDEDNKENVVSSWFYFALLFVSRLINNSLRIQYSTLEEFVIITGVLPLVFGNYGAGT